MYIHNIHLYYLYIAHQALPVHGILQARILEWVAMPFLRDLPDSGIEPRSPALQAIFFFFLSSEPPRKPYTEILQHPNPLCQLCLYRTHHYLKLSHVCYLSVFSVCQSFAYLLADIFPTYVSQTPLPKIMGGPGRGLEEGHRSPHFSSSPRPSAVRLPLVGSSSTERAMLPARAEQPWLPGASHPLSLTVLFNPRV